MKTDTYGAGGAAHGAQQPTVSHGNSVFVHPQAESTWQPIATAPKDGTWILLYGSNRMIHTGLWDAKFDYEFNKQTDDIEYIPQWTNHHVESWALEEYQVLNPTHWMPLPSAPKE